MNAAQINKFISVKIVNAEIIDTRIKQPVKTWAFVRNSESALLRRISLVVFIKIAHMVGRDNILIKTIWFTL